MVREVKSKEELASSLVLEGLDEVLEGWAETSVTCEEAVGVLGLEDVEGLVLEGIGKDDLCSLSDW